MATLCLRHIWVVMLILCTTIVGHPGTRSNETSLTVKNPNASSCLKNDTDYPQRVEDVILNVSSAIACQAWCFHDPKCAFFSWVSDEFPDPSLRRKCYLKHLYAPAKPLKGVISGPDECLPQKVPLPLAQQLGHPLICNPPKVNREGTGTLVVVLASLRAMRLTYDGLRIFVLETLGTKVHLAFSVARGPQYRDYFRYADYVWEVDEPLQFDFQDYFNEISRTCYNRSFTKQDTFSITKGGNLLGGLSGISGSGAPQMFFKWVALQQMAHLGLFDRYQHIIVTRSDRMYAKPHPPVNRLPPMHVLIPQGQDYGGVNDRHLVMHSSDAPHILNQLHMLLYVPLRLQKFPLGTDAWPNCEAGLKWWLAEHLHLRISRFSNVAYLVTDRLYNNLGKTPNTYGQLRLGHIPIFPKYPEEYGAVTENLKKKPGMGGRVVAGVAAGHPAGAPQPNEEGSLHWRRRRECRWGGTREGRVQGGWLGWEGGQALLYLRTDGAVLRSLRTPHPCLYLRSEKWWCGGLGTGRVQGTWYGSGLPAPHYCGWRVHR